MTRREFITMAGVAIVAGSATSGALSVAGQIATPPVVGGFTPNDRFYVTSYGGTPQVDANSWRLRVYQDWSGSH